jgi:hypothetical protein
MFREYRTGTAPSSGRESSRHLHWLAMAAVLAILLAPIMAALWAHGVGVARAQDEIAAADTTLPGQVIAQGIARLPRGEVVWTVRSIEAPAGEGLPVASFPVGFAVADGATIAVLDADGKVLHLLADGEAAFLPEGKAGALASWQDDAARLYEVALVSSREAGAGETPGTVVGNPFDAPEGAAFDIEIARAVLARDDQATIPVSRSGAPVLYLQTTGATQLQAAGGQPVELAAGQFAMILGGVTASGASDEPATFLVASIGEATAERDAREGTPEAGASREDRQRVRDTATASDPAPRAKRARRVRTGGGAAQGGQTAPQSTGSTGSAPVSGAVTGPPPLDVPAGAPAMEPTIEATLPGETTVPDEGTPPPDATMPTDGEAPAEATETPDPAAPPVDEVPTEDPTAGEPSPTVEAPPGEDTPPIDEAPAEDPPLAEEPVAELTPEA